MDKLERIELCLKTMKMAREVALTVEQQKKVQVIAEAYLEEELGLALDR